MLFARLHLSHCEYVVSDPASMKSLNGGPCAFRSDHGYEAEIAGLVTSAIEHNIYLCDIAISGKAFLQLVFGRGWSNVFNVYFGGHNGVQSLSQIFVRVTYPVEPFGFEFVSGHPMPLVFNSERNGLRQQPDLFGKLGNGQADEFQSVHSDGLYFNSPQSARGGKKGGPAMISIFANQALRPQLAVWCCVSVPRGNKDRHLHIGNCRV